MPNAGIKYDPTHGWIDVETPRDSFDADYERERFYEPPALDPDAQEAFNRVCERAPEMTLEEWLARPGHIVQLNERRRADLHHQAIALKAYGPVLLADSRVSPQAFDALLRRLMELSRAFPEPMQEEPPF